MPKTSPKPAATPKRRSPPPLKWLPSAVYLTAALSPLSTYAQSTPTPTGEPWRIITPAQAPRGLGRDGSVIRELGRERRLNVALRTLPTMPAVTFSTTASPEHVELRGTQRMLVAPA